MIYLGQSLRRFEDHRLLTGQSQFVDDITLPDMLHAVVLRSPHAHATITAIDVAAARHATGVVAVVTASDLEQLAAHIPTRRNADADEIRPPEHPVLASDKVCYVGQPVAIVVAQSPAAARDAVDLIEVDYAPLPAVIDPLQAMHPDTPVVHAELGTNCVLKVTSAGGDLEAAFARADHVVRQQYQVQRLAPVPMETRGLVARRLALPTIPVSMNRRSTAPWNCRIMPPGERGPAIRDRLKSPALGLAWPPWSKVRVPARPTSSNMPE